MVEIPEIMLAEIRANQTRILGFFSINFKKDWKDVFPLTEKNVKEGWIPLSDLAWRVATNP